MAEREQDLKRIEKESVRSDVSRKESPDLGGYLNLIGATIGIFLPGGSLDRTIEKKKVRPLASSSPGHT